MTTCINLQTGHLFNYKTFPDADAITAIRASISVPVLYIPIKIGNTYVGALISNYPIEYAENNNKKTVLGIILSDQSMPAFEQIISIDGYLRNTLYSVLNSIDEGKIKKYYDITIALSLNAGPLSFNEIKNKKSRLRKRLQSGRRQMRKNTPICFGLYNPMIKHISH